MFAQLGARGVSVFFGSGDEGVGPTGYCHSNDGVSCPLPLQPVAVALPLIVFWEPP